MSLVIYCDGLCEPTNPHGVATYGWVAYRDAIEIAKGYNFIKEGEGATNNCAEYTAVIRAIAWLWKTDQHYEPTIIRSDSQLTIKQLTGEWRVKSETIRPLYEKALRGLEGLEQYELEWVRRELNIRADELSRIAYQEHIQSHKECVAHRFQRERW